VLVVVINVNITEDNKNSTFNDAAMLTIYLCHIIVSHVSVCSFGIDLRKKIKSFLEGVTQSYSFGGKRQIIAGGCKF